MYCSFFKGLNIHLMEKTQNNQISENIKVSIILPVWNPGSGIERCIQSLREQTLREIEMIFVDDCGTDDAMEKVRTAAAEDPRIRIIRNPENLGPGPSRNAGIAAARGEYLQFTDPDDYLDAGYLEELWQEADNNNLDIVKGRLVYETEDGTQIRHKDRNFYIKKGIDQGYPLFTVLTNQHQSLLISRSLLTKHQIFYGNSRCGEDSTFLLRLGYTEVSFGLCETGGTYHYKYREDSSMSSFNDRKLMNTLDGFREQIGFLLNRKIDLYAQKYFLLRVEYMLVLHAKASSFPELEESAADFFSGLCEQVKRFPLADPSVSNNLYIRGLMKYKQNLLIKPYPSSFARPGLRDYMRTGMHTLRFVFQHPYELPAVIAEFSRIIQRKLTGKL